MISIAWALLCPQEIKMQTSWTTSKTQGQALLQTWTITDIHRGQWDATSDLTNLANRYKPISLDQMEAVALMERTDTKFVMSIAQLRTALESLHTDYWILSVQGQRLIHYRTLYFDTPGFDLYLMHVNGRANRYKVRSREYTDTHLSFLEVKHRTPKDLTIKDRLSTQRPVTWMTLEAQNWLQGIFPYDSQTLEPKIWNTFTRMTLVSKQHCERVTLAVDLTCYTANNVARLDNIAIAEVKMERFGCTSPFIKQIQTQKVHPRGFSKYCIGVGMLSNRVKKNTLKPKLMWLDKMIRGVATYE